MPHIVNVTFDANGGPDHVGIGYRVVLPSGQVATASGFTWTPAPGQATALGAILQAMVKAAMDNEGVANAAYTVRNGQLPPGSGAV